MEKILFPFEWKDEDTEMDEHELQIWCFDRNSNPCLLRIIYTIPYYLELPETDINGRNINWNENTIQELIHTLTGGSRPILPNSSYNSITYAQGPTFFRYLQGDKKFLKIRFHTSAYPKKLIKKLDKRITVGDNTFSKINLWESRVESTHKFVVERKLKYASWFKIMVTQVEEEDDRISFLDNEYIGVWDTATTIPEDECLEWTVHPRLLAFDIEARSINKSMFPNEYKPTDIAFMISCTYEQFQIEGTKKKYSIVMGDCYPPDDTTVIRVYSESELCIAFAKILHDLNIDILMGHNIFKFDFKYLNQRLENFGETWPDYGGRLKGVKPKLIDASWSSSNTNTVDLIFIEFSGRISYDTYNILKSPSYPRLPSYSLNNCAKHYLENTKVDLSYEELFAGIDKCLVARDLMEKCIVGYDEDGTPRIHTNISDKIWKEVLLKYHDSMLIMKRLMEYCDKDSELVLLLFNKLHIWYNSVTSSNIIQVKIKYIHTKGQQYKGFAQLYTLLKENNVVMDSVNEVIPEGKYKGALNLGKLYGITGYLPMVFMLDVNSMYPSIIIGYNICRTTEVTPEYAKLHPDDVTHHAWTDEQGSYDIWLLKSHIHEGFLPRLSAFLLNSRSKVKKELEKAKKGTLLHTILDGIQLAYKISANSLYGVLGSSKNPIIPFKRGAALVTKIGRDTLLNISEYVTAGARLTEKAKEEALSYPEGEKDKHFKILEYTGRLFKSGELKIVYGDTDSVAIQVLVEGMTSQEMIRLSKYFAQSVNDQIAPLGIKPEKYGDLMIETAKKYIFHSFDEHEFLFDGQPNPEFGNYSKYNYVGMELVRRNNANILKTLLRDLCDILMREPMDPNDRIVLAMDNIFTTIHKMFHYKVPIEDYMVYQGYNTESDTTPMGVFAREMAAIGKPIQVGERVPFVYVNYPGESKKSALGLKLRFPDNINANERIDVYKYINLFKNAVDLLMCARFTRSIEYQKFMERISKNIYKHLDGKIFKELTGNSISNIYISKIKEDLARTSTTNNDGSKYTHIIDNLPLDPLDIQHFRSTLTSADKTRLTRAVNNVAKTGFKLLLNEPNIISNILYAEKIGILKEYTRAMVSDRVYKELYGNN